MIFKKTEEVVCHVAIDSETSFDLLKPDLKRAEKEYLIPCLGKTFHATLESEYLNEELDDDHTELLSLCQDVVALFAIHNALPLLQVQVSDMGVHLHSTDTQKTAWQWQINELDENYLQRLGYVAIDCLLEYLEDNKATYTEWAEGEGYTCNKEFIISSPSDFQKYYHINKSATTYKAFLPTMSKVEMFYLVPVLGQTFYDEIKAEIAAGNVSEDNKKLFIYLKASVAYYTVYEALKTLPLTLRSDGVVINQIKSNTENRKEQLGVFNHLLSRADKTKADACKFMDLLIKYLKANAAEDKYASYYTYAGLDSTESETEIQRYNDDGSTTKKFVTL